MKSIMKTHVQAMVYIIAITAGMQHMGVSSNSSRCGNVLRDGGGTNYDK